MAITMQEMVQKYRGEAKTDKINCFRFRQDVIDDLAYLVDMYGLTKTAIVEIAITNLRVKVEEESAD